MIQRTWPVLAVVIIVLSSVATWLIIKKGTASFEAFDDPWSIDPIRALEEATIKPTNNVGPNDFTKLKVVYERSLPATCPDGYSPTVQMPFYKKVVADRVERDGDPYQRGVGIAAVKNSNYPGQIVLGYDKLFTTYYSSNNKIIYAKYVELYQKVRQEPKMIDKAVAASFESWYDESALVGKLDPGRSIDISKSKPIKICEQASSSGGGVGG